MESQFNSALHALVAAISKESPRQTPSIIKELSARVANHFMGSAMLLPEYNDGDIESALLDAGIDPTKRTLFSVAKPLLSALRYGDWNPWPHGILGILPSATSCGSTKYGKAFASMSSDDQHQHANAILWLEEHGPYHPIITELAARVDIRKMAGRFAPGTWVADQTSNSSTVTDAELALVLDALRSGEQGSGALRGLDVASPAAAIAKLRRRGHQIFVRQDEDVEWGDWGASSRGVCAVYWLDKRGGASE